jgi:hypothetical protein
MTSAMSPLVSGEALMKFVMLVMIIAKTSEKSDDVSIVNSSPTKHTVQQEPHFARPDAVDVFQRLDISMHIGVVQIRIE